MLKFKRRKMYMQTNSSLESSNTSDIQYLLSKINDLSKDLSSVISDVHSHVNNTKYHYNEDQYNSLYNRLSSIESKLSNLNSETLSTIAKLSRSDVENLLSLSKSIDSIENMIKYQYILFDYILNKTSAPQNIKNIINTIKTESKSEENTLVNETEIQTYEESEEPYHVDESVINAYNVIQNDRYRFVTTEQIEAWDKTKSDIDILKRKINYTEDSSIINLKNIPIADESNDGIITSDTYKDIKNIKVPTPDWNVIDPKDINYIINKPDALPADGGNADTIGGLTKDELLSKDKFGYTIGYRSSKALYDYYLEDASIIDIFKDIQGKVVDPTKPIRVEIPSIVIDIVSNDDVYVEYLDLRFNNTIINIKAKSITFEGCNISNAIFNGVSENYIVIKNDNKISNSSFNNIILNIIGSRNEIHSNRFNSEHGITMSGSKGNICSYNIISSNILRNNATLFVDGSYMTITKNNICFNSFDGDVVIKGSNTTYNTFMSNTYTKDNIIVVKGGANNFFLEGALDRISFSSIILASNNDSGSTKKSID
jgi:tetrahydromethanopterin S-methyltransferase subunit G